MKRILLTCGDPNGIGLEVTAKALEKLGPQKGVRFILFRSRQSELKQLKRIDKKFNRITVKNLEDALVISNSGPAKLIDIESSESAPHWVEQAARACHKKSASGMVTAPLSKTLIQSEGYNAKGHTEILQKISGVKDVHMVFIGHEFNVLLATGHLALEKVTAALSGPVLERALKHALSLRKVLPQAKQKLPVALVGLNPHAGESGLLGKQEIELFSPLIKKLARPLRRGLGEVDGSILRDSQDIVGPLSPDAAFLKQNWNRFSVFVCPYHDQGLIPFKMIHGTRGFHLTFGLSFIRTSVDHGTAFDIFGKNKADGSSMLDAIRACIAMSR